MVCVARFGQLSNQAFTLTIQCLFTAHCYANYQTLGGAGFSALAMGRMMRTVVSRGINTGIKATHGKGLGTKRTTRISATPTSRRIKIILPHHFRFSRFIRMSLLHASSPVKLRTVSVQGLVPQTDFTG